VLLFLIRAFVVVIRASVLAIRASVLAIRASVLVIRAYVLAIRAYVLVIRAAIVCFVRMSFIYRTAGLERPRLSLVHVTTRPSDLRSSFAFHG
jgi:hypothetical protein